MNFRILPAEIFYCGGIFCADPTWKKLFFQNLVCFDSEITCYSKPLACCSHPVQLRIQPLSACCLLGFDISPACWCACYRRRCGPKHPVLREAPTTPRLVYSRAAAINCYQPPQLLKSGGSGLLLFFFKNDSSKQYNVTIAGTHHDWGEG